MTDPAATSGHSASPAPAEAAPASSAPPAGSPDPSTAQPATAPDVGSADPRSAPPTPPPAAPPPEPDQPASPRSLWLWPAMVTAAIALIGQFLNARSAAGAIAVAGAGASGVLIATAAPRKSRPFAAAAGVIVGIIVLLVLWAQLHKVLPDTAPTDQSTSGSTATPPPATSTPPTSSTTSGSPSP